MSEVLSQSEIDALLAAMAAGDIIDDGGSNNSGNENDVTETVLEDSLKFSDEDIHILEYIHKEYAQIISSNMSKNLNVRVSLASIQEIRYKEFSNSIPYPAVINLFKLNPLEGYLLFETSPELVVQIANVFFGEDVSGDVSKAEFSERDKDISMKIVKEFIEDLEKAWDKVLKVNSTIEHVQTNPAKITMFTENESVVLASFSISICEVNTLFNICIPYSSIENYLGKLKVKGSPCEFKLSNNFGDANLNIKVVLDNIELSLGELMNLQKGTILSTHKRYQNKVSILVEEKHCFNGEVGLMENRKAVKIVDCLERND
ncbi:flagellar motor switch protein FliM [Clostridium magnum]|uniref:Flagellar motor switch protein FliM n=1 Tax=Clostridium magnum DSM 2767 TaxID=1121326 RepID=A0A161WWD4_9CLOT|nr:FliM/FliN family flagellar motor switch protein [Clostridium magnum]KZL91278.1 flagellar motor switch protein FliM [Clostridium magnum DSM 2767]SHI35733.1 flagellar motor switch protein FliM [Clostridium magnum DSM 2767]